jgi:hypothetical protein
MMALVALLQVHEGEQYYVFGWKELAFIGALVLVWLLLKAFKSEPGVQSMKMFVDLSNSRGGNILICLFLTVYFFAAAMRIFYHALGLVVDKTLDPTSAVLMMALQFVTGTAFGGAFGALLKTMSPETARTPLPGQGPNASSSSTTSSTSSSSSTPVGSVTIPSISGSSSSTLVVAEAPPQ